MKPEDTLDFHLRWAWAKTAKLYNAEAVKHGITMSIGYALVNIDREGTPSTKLGPKMGMEPTSLTRLLKNMEDMNLIKRIPDAKDRRIMRVVLTDHGIDMREKTKEKVIHFNHMIQSRISNDEMQTFFKVIQQINQFLEEDIFQSK